jgi:hypothetical protein
MCKCNSVCAGFRTCTCVRVCICVRVHVPLCVCVCICAHRYACTHACVRAYGGPCMHMCVMRVSRFCSCIITALEPFSGVGLPSGNPCSFSNSGASVSAAEPHAAKPLAVVEPCEEFPSMRDTLKHKTIVRNCPKTGALKYCDLKGQCKVVFDHSFKPYIYTEKLYVNIYAWLKPCTDTVGTYLYTAVYVRTVHIRHI